MKLLYFIFCDDIRFEINNKFSLIGMYSDSIILQLNKEIDISKPFPLRLSTFLKFKAEEKEIYPDGFEFHYFMNNKNILNVNGKLDIPQTQLFLNLALNTAGIPIEKGYLGFTVKLFNKGNIIFSEENLNSMQVIFQQI